MTMLARTLALLAVLLTAATPVVASTATEFYDSLLLRGVSSYEAERYADAVQYLRLAAFGFVDSVERYQKAQVYLALSYDRMNEAERAREAVRRVITAERIERKFSAIALPVSVASSFDGVAARLVGAAEAGTLRRGPQISSSTSTATPPRTQPQQQQPPRTTSQTTPQTTPQQTTPQQNTTQQANPPQTTTTPAKPIVPPQDNAPATKPPATTTTTNNTPATTASKPPSNAPVTPEKKPPAATTAQKPPTTTTATTPPKPVTSPPATTPATTPSTTQTTGTTTGTPPKQTPPSTAPATPATTAPAPKPAITAQEVSSRLAAGERALTSAQLPEARRVYRALLDAQGVPRDSLIRIAEGLYRARDFEGSLAAFAKAGTLHRGEEPYHYYMAVAYYETAQYARAKAAFAAAVPFIELTPDVERYRAKIEAAKN